MHNKQFILRSAVSATIAGLCLGSAAMAQTDSGSPAASDNLLEEILVTAQRRSQNLQEVPISVSALTGDDLDTYRFRDPSELAEQVANLTANPSAGAGVPIFGLRGVSMTDWSLNQASPIAPYIDEVYKGNPAFLSVPLFDMERIEVLRGPQGTLWGKNTTGGAVNFVSKRPVLENQAYITVGAGNYSLIEAEGAVNVALSENVAIRLAGSYADADGWYETVTPGVDDAFSTDEHAVRLSVLWQAQDNVEVILRAFSAKSEPTTFATKFLEEAAPTYFGAYGLFNAFGGTPFADPSMAGLDFFEHSSGSDETILRESQAFSATINWELSSNYLLTSITSWDDGEATTPDRSDGVVQRAVEANYTVDAEQFTQELRLTSSMDGPFNFVAGLYYAGEELESTNDIGLFLDIDFNLDGAVDVSDCFDPISIAFGFPPSAAGAATESLFNSLGFSLGGFATLGCVAANSFEQERTSYAAYFDGSYDLTEALKLRFGLRYTDDESELSRFNAHFASRDGIPLLGSINGGALDPLATVPTLEFSDTEITARIGLDYTLTNGTLLYASFSQGYRGGAFNAQAYYAPGELNAVDPEYVDSWEIGFKSTLWDDRVRLNGSAFYYTYENQQFLDFDPATQIQTLVNVDESTITGLELELAAHLTSALILQFGLGLLDAEIDKGILNGASIAGEALPMAPDLNFNVTIDWMVYESDTGSLNLNVNGNFQDDTLYFISRGFADSYSLVNARLTYTANDANWSASLWGRNLADEEYATSFYNGLVDFGIVNAFIGPPRTYGVELSYRF